MVICVVSSDLYIYKQLELLMKLTIELDVDVDDVMTSILKFGTECCSVYIFDYIYNWRRVMEMIHAYSHTRV